VTEWFLGKNENSIKSPTAAVKSLGVYVRPLLPTWTWMVAAVAVDAAATMIAFEKCIMLIGYMLYICENKAELCSERD